MNPQQLVRYGLLALLLAFVLQHIWIWIVGGLAVFGALYLLHEINRNRRN